MTRCELYDSTGATVWKLTVNGDEVPSRGDALAVAKRRAAGDVATIDAAIIKKTEDAVYVVTWSDS